MKMMVDIDDELLQRARRLADDDGVSLDTLVERGLRLAIGSREALPGPFRIRNASFRGEGLCSDLRESSWAEIRDRAGRH